MLKTLSYTFVLAGRGWELGQGGEATAQAIACIPSGRHARGESRNLSKWSQTWSQHGPKMLPTWFQMVPKSSQTWSHHVNKWPNMVKTWSHKHLLHVVRIAAVLDLHIGAQTAAALGCAALARAARVGVRRRRGHPNLRFGLVRRRAHRHGSLGACRRRENTQGRRYAGSKHKVEVGRSRLRGSMHEVGAVCLGPCEPRGSKVRGSEL